MSLVDHTFIPASSGHSCYQWLLIKVSLNLMPFPGSLSVLMCSSQTTVSFSPSNPRPPFFLFSNCRLFLRLGIYKHTPSKQALPTSVFLLLLYAFVYFILVFSHCSFGVSIPLSFQYKHTLHTLLLLWCLCFKCSVHSVFVWHAVPKCPTLLGGPISPIPIRLGLLQLCLIFSPPETLVEVAKLRLRHSRRL